MRSTHSHALHSSSRSPMMCFMRRTVPRSSRGLCTPIRSTFCFLFAILNLCLTLSNPQLATHLSYQRSLLHRACVSKRSNCVARRRRFVTFYHLRSSLEIDFSPFWLASRNRTQGTARDQRKAPRVDGKGGVSQVRSNPACLFSRNELTRSLTGTSRAVSLHKVLLKTSKWLSAFFSTASANVLTVYELEVRKLIRVASLSFTLLFFSDFASAMRLCVP